MQNGIEQMHQDMVLKLTTLSKEINRQAKLTFTTELDHFDNPVSYCLAGDVIDNDGYLVPVGEATFISKLKHGTLSCTTRRISKMSWYRLKLKSNFESNTMKDYALAIAIGLALTIGALHYFDVLIK